MINKISGILWGLQNKIMIWVEYLKLLQINVDLITDYSQQSMFISVSIQSLMFLTF